MTCILKHKFHYQTTKKRFRNSSLQKYCFKRKNYLEVYFSKKKKNNIPIINKFHIFPNDKRHTNQIALGDTSLSCLQFRFILMRFTFEIVHMKKALRTIKFKADNGLKLKNICLQKYEILNLHKYRKQLKLETNEIKFHSS